MSLDFSAPFTERTPRIVAAAKLHRAAARRKAKAFLVEGENAVEAAVTTGAARDVYVTEQAAQRYEAIVKSAQYLSVYVHPISDKAARSLSDTVTTTGIFAVCDPVLWPMKRALTGTPRLVSVPVHTSDPGNAGTLIRVSDAMGANAVVFAGETVDPLGNKVVRSSAGSLFHLPVSRETQVEAVMDSLRSRGLQILATAADGEVDLDEAGDLLEAPTAWLFGNEAHGLGEELLSQADHRVRIPIRGRAESLNLATAASICLYESARTQARVAGLE
ncbi:TrmH family RNA methyltransferase [Corynebacterium lowii]|uniref:23S rRNA (Uridine(2479)-2'-O)-methyltransferase n=1 Tax=Corynebacterium lowii TaxID=1544413 RepID=A0A0Q0U3I4_9CORY|nr:RNA methyltransferase [Corynebacterium lowii]KQB86467.1 23S rRNA (uridine(2479)-2'-O)-methyltransferase [Corynebacterium lowii]MDP9850951.1 TrmH family RNA methyltransferase [Corynebacterium lowii]